MYWFVQYIQQDPIPRTAGLGALILNLSLVMYLDGHYAQGLPEKYLNVYALTLFTALLLPPWIFYRAIIPLVRRREMDYVERLKLAESKEEIDQLIHSHRRVHGLASKVAAYEAIAAKLETVTDTDPSGASLSIVNELNYLLATCEHIPLISALLDVLPSIGNETTFYGLTSLKRTMNKWLPHVGTVEREQYAARIAEAENLLTERLDRESKGANLLRPVSLQSANEEKTLLKPAGNHATSDELLKPFE